MNQKLKTGYCIISAIIFTLFAALQYNDPDPMIWIAAYMLVTAISMISVYRPIPYFVLLPIILMYFSGAVYLWPQTYMGVTMPMSYKPEIELARESIGLGIAAIALSGILLFSKERITILRFIGYSEKRS